MNCKYLPSITATMSPSCRSRRGKAAVSLLGGCCLSPLRQRTMTGEYLASSDAISLNRGRSAGFISQHRCIRLLISLGAATASLSLSPFLSIWRFQTIYIVHVIVLNWVDWIVPSILQENHFKSWQNLRHQESPKLELDIGIVTSNPTQSSSKSPIRRAGVAKNKQTSSGFQL